MKGHQENTILTSMKGLEDAMTDMHTTLTFLKNKMIECNIIFMERDHADVASDTPPKTVH